ncbi:MAG: toprim domain-containing protein, partial [Muribaculaceae bacterium]|nr:toprim domain-containing protein [Muribaculaceae bacterium]
HFESNLSDTDDGRAIGLGYFRERGINDWAVKRFHLGYSLDRRNDLLTAARNAGYNDEYLVNTGLCIRSDRGELYDRFKARVMYPIFTISGKVVAFGGRTLRSDKSVAKYVNSPESRIYSKSHELYGLYQAKQAIVKKDKCILVEGYMDVISMHQQGMENVVASSGTSLTQGQIRLIHRFTENVTVIYDSDPAGIKASLRGIDLLLAEGLDIKVMLLPEGDDPDSFAQSHTAAEVEEYLAANEVDFIKFKIDILLKDAAGDPVKHAKVVASIIESIANIPVELKRTFYIKECSMRFGIGEEVLLRQLNVSMARLRENNARTAQRQNARQSVDSPDFPPVEPPADYAQGQQEAPAAEAGTAAAPAEVGRHVAGEAQGAGAEVSPHARMLEPQERALLRLVVKFGMMDLGQDFAGSESQGGITVIDYVEEDLAVDGVKFANPLYQRIFDEALELRRNTWDSDYAAHYAAASARREAAVEEGRRELARTAADMSEIRIGEKKLEARVSEEFDADLRDFRLLYLEKVLASHPDDTVRRVVTELVVEKHHLSKIYFKTTKVETEADRLPDLVPRALIALKYDMARCYADDLRRQIREMQQRPEGYDFQEILSLMETQKRWQDFSATLASHIGERVYEPLRGR